MELKRNWNIATHKTNHTKKRTHTHNPNTKEQQSNRRRQKKIIVSKSKIKVRCKRLPFAIILNLSNSTFSINSTLVLAPDEWTFSIYLWIFCILYGLRHKVLENKQKKIEIFCWAQHTYTKWSRNTKREKKRNESII